MPATRGKFLSTNVAAEALLVQRGLTFQAQMQSLLSCKFRALWGQTASGDREMDGQELLKQTETLISAWLGAPRAKTADGDSEPIQQEPAFHFWSETP